MKPCEAECPKCGSADVHRKYMEPGQVQVSRDTRIVDNEFVTVADRVAGLSRDVKVKRECIAHHCRECGYDWWGHTRDCVAKPGRMERDERDDLSDVEWFQSVYGPKGRSNAK